MITTCTLIGFGYASLFHIPLTARAAPIHETTIDDIDFENNKDKAKNYATEKVREQASKMTSVGKQAIKDFNEKNGKIINDYLLANKGKLVPNDQKNEDIKRLDATIQNQTIGKDIRLYANLAISKERLSGFLGKAIEMPHYLKTSLHYDSGNTPLWIIEANKDTHGVFTIQNGSEGIILERGVGVEVKSVKEVTYKGIVRTVVEAKLISKKDFPDKKIDMAHQQLTNEMGIPVSIQLTGDKEMLVDRAIASISNVLDAFKNINSITPNLQQVIFKTLARTGVKIILQDTPVDNKGSIGGYNPNTNEIRINVNNQEFVGRPSDWVFAHELGHAMDHKLFNLQIGSDLKFQKIFSQEKVAYAKEFGFDIDNRYPQLDTFGKCREYWADAFAKFLLKNDRLKTTTPQTYQYMKDTLSNLH
ncbi:hypothetical protein BK708_25295 [Bacillus thuringiensis serovar yunnanensis]|nr:hypothetical protein BK708_25295 [Bacillus thuringiensis serovar yunnanensis]